MPADRLRHAALLLLALHLALAAVAQGPATPRDPGARLDAPAVTLAPHASGIAALLADGRLVHVARGGTRVLARGLDGEVLIACGGGLLAIDAASGALVRIGGRYGPPVSLHATPACLADGAVLAIDPDGTHLLRLDAELHVVARAPLAALPDAEPAILDGGAVAVPVTPTQRYRHGVLGDEVESAGLAIVDPATLTVLGRWEAPAGMVIEQRRLTPFPAAGPRGLVATLSGAGNGGALAVLSATADDGASTGAGSADLAPVAIGDGLGREMRWRHVLGAAGPRLYSVATPHLGGPLERWTLAPEGPGMRYEAFELGVTSHRIGRRELDLGRLLPRAEQDPVGLDLLLLPGRELRALKLIACDASGCRVVHEAALDAPLSASPWPVRGTDGALHVWIADRRGEVRRLTIPRDGIPTNPE